MFKQIHLFTLLIVNCLIFIASLCVKNATASQPSSSVAIPIGAVLNLNSPLGSMIELCMEMAIADFYAAHPDYVTRLQLHVRNATGVLDANLAALELIDHKEVQGIIVTQGSTQETMFAELAQRAHVPIISLVSQHSPTSNNDNRYIVRTGLDDTSRAQALLAICQTFEWHQIVLLYEDADYGYQFLSYMSKVLQEVEIKVEITAISSSASDHRIQSELKRLGMKQTIFLVHLNPSLGVRLFNLAKKEEVMSEGFAWLITDSISLFMNSMDLEIRNSMEGVIGIRPYVRRSKELETFQERFHRNVVMKNKTSEFKMELNAHGLWAYDAVTTLAIAVENIIKKTSVGISKLGTSLIDELTNTKFNGFSGEFKLFDGKSNISGYEIFNVFGSGEKIIGFWKQDKGVVREWSSATETKGVKSVIWPGDSVKQPKGWDIPRKVTIAVPPKSGFPEFLNKSFDSSTKEYRPTGFCVDIFMAVLNVLPFTIDYEFHFYDSKYANHSYDEIISNRTLEDYDMVVGDITMWAPRAKYVDFSIPYSEGGVVLVVKNKKPVDMWIFVKPLNWDLWLAIVLTCILVGIVLRVLEHNLTRNQVESIERRNKHHQMVYLSPVAVLAFPERNMVSNKWSFVVLVFWLFMAYILMQSYTANLSAILTVDQLKFAFSDDYFVGYQEGSFLKTFLTEKMSIPESRLRPYSTAEDYHEGMSLGSKRGGIDAIFDEIPYMKVFLKKYDSQYKIAGPTYWTGGLAFAFRPNSPLVQHFSKAILEITQSPYMTSIEQQNFGPGYSSQDPLSSTITQHTSSLALFDFAGLFIIIAAVLVFALFCSETRVGQMLTARTDHFLHDVFAIFRSSSDDSIRDASNNGDSVDMSGEDDSHAYAMNNNTISTTGDNVIEEITQPSEDVQSS